MKRDFLKNLGLEDDVIDKILDENSRDIGREKQKTTTAETALETAKTDLTAVQTELETLKQTNGDVAAMQKQLTDLQAKYDTDTAALNAQLADRDYSDAARRSVADKGLKFSSKAAERDFYSRLKEKQLAIKDGTLEGFDDYVKAQKEAEPDSFASDKPVPRLVTPMGKGGEPQAGTPENVALAQAMGKTRADSLKASTDVLSHYL